MLRQDKKKFMTFLIQKHANLVFRITILSYGKEPDPFALFHIRKESDIAAVNLSVNAVRKNGSIRKIQSICRNSIEFNGFQVRIHAAFRAYIGFLLDFLF